MDYSFIVYGLTDKTTARQLSVRGIDFLYNYLPESEFWKIDLINKIIEIRHGDIEVTAVDKSELDLI